MLAEGSAASSPELAANSFQPALKLLCCGLSPARPTPGPQGAFLSGPSLRCLQDWGSHSCQPWAVAGVPEVMLHQRCCSGADTGSSAGPTVVADVAIFPGCTAPVCLLGNVGLCLLPHGPFPTEAAPGLPILRGVQCGSGLCPGRHKNVTSGFRSGVFWPLRVILRAAPALPLWASGGPPEVTGAVLRRA